MTTPQPMTVPPPVSDTGKQDREHLQILSILHFLLGLGSLALLLFKALFLLIPLVTMVIPEIQADLGAESAPQGAEAIGWLLAAIMVTMGLAMLMLFLAIALNGVLLWRQQGRVFCFIVAVIECLFLPLGTILGVFTLVVLSRPSVRLLFERRGHLRPSQP